MSLATSPIVVFIKKHPIGVGGVAVALLLMVASYLRAGDMSDLEVELDDRTRQGQRLKNNLRYAQQLDEHLETATQAAELIDRRIINPSNLATNLQYFYRLESELGLRIIDLRQGSAGKKQGNANYVPVPFNVAVEGTYPQLLEFVQNLEYGNHFVRFISSNLAPSRGNPSDGMVADNEPRLVLSLNIELLGRP